MISARLRNKFCASLVTVLALASVILPPVLVRSELAAADNLAAEDRGAMGLGQAIRRLGVVATVLHTGAHPDDEDSGLLAYLARGRQARTAYLSLTRGDGGQNVIGPEIYEPLGVIRTEELLAARRLDGASQFFTRAYDFGFSKSRTETLKKWDREEVLSDMVRVIRTFRPQVIVSAWSGTPNDGHGHHQAAGLLTREAYIAAADPTRFPEQGLRPWQTKKLYIRSFDGAASPREYLPSLATLSINTGEYDQLLGRSYYEIAARGRSQHRSQDQGTIEARGPRFSRLRLIDSKVGPIKNERDIFEDIDTSIVGIASYAGPYANELHSLLAEAQTAATEVRDKYNPLAPGAISSTIARGLKNIREGRERLRVIGELLDKQLSTINTPRMTKGERAETDFLLKQKEADFADALAKSEGAVVDCLSDAEVVVPGQTFSVTVTAYADTKALGISLSTPAGWTVVQGKQQSGVTEGRLSTQTEFKVTVARDAEPTRPYWLKKPRTGDMFAVPSTPASSSMPAMTGIEPVAPPDVSAKVEFEASDQKYYVVEAIQYRYADHSLGEVRREVRVAPAISVSCSPEILIYPISNAAQERDVIVSLINNSKEGSRGSVTVEAPAVWTVEPQGASFDLKRKGERAAISFSVKAPLASAESRQTLKVVATVGDARYEAGYQLIDYPHIEPRFFYRAARSEAEVIDVKVASPLKVGFIEGAGDDFAAALKQIGVDVRTIDAKELAAGDLSVYDTIVSGIRAYEVRPDLVANNERLMDYVNRGGTYIVQYNRGNFETAGYGPYRFSAQSSPPRGQRRGREARLLYLVEADIAEALAPRSGKVPTVGVLAASGDPIVSALQKANVAATSLEPSEVAGGDLNRYDVIVVGATASASRPDLRENNQRLLDYAKEKLIVLAYNQSQFESGDFPRYPKPEAKPFRTTDENAVVTILEPNHPRFNFPNKIGERDFDGWVQERGAYFLSNWDPRYKPLMSCHDEGEPDLKGGEVIAEYGKGLYVYTAYAWFRELPKGVPGAYRLIANLVSLPKTRNETGSSR